MQIAGLNVSRETIAALRDFQALLLKWNPRINLISAASIPHVQQRHIIDTAQVFSLRPASAKTWVDLGSGGGLPGVVCAILAKELSPQIAFTLVESDKRKAAFLSVCKQELGLEVAILSARIEELDGLSADVISARALAPLPQLLPLVEHHLDRDGLALLPKGKNYLSELEAVRNDWHFDVAIYPSQTDDMARILALKDIKRV